MADTHVAVIGGGCAGLAAAATLAASGIAVTLIESSPQLGGRARSVKWKGLALDNGQHILLGAYSSTLQLLTLAGVRHQDALLRMPLQLSMLTEFNPAYTQPSQMPLDAAQQSARPAAISKLTFKLFELKACKLLPAPLHILAGLLQARGLSMKDKLYAIRFMLWLRLVKFTLPTDQPLQQVLADQKQSAALIRLLWEPLCLAALNTPLYMASAQVFFHVLRDSFSRSKNASDMLLPRYDLSTLLAEPVAAYIIANGGSIQTNTPVTSLAKHKRGFAVTSHLNSEDYYSHVILAVSPSRLPDLCSSINAAITPQVAMAENLHYQPIYTVYLQYHPSVSLPQAMLGFASSDTSRLCQWVFDRGALYGQHGLLAVVISAEGRHQKLTQQALALCVEAELAEAFAGMPTALWHKVIAEKRATFSCDAHIQRPQQRTPIEHLYLAGDYTAGDYPATIEGAVRSGVQCAQYVII